MTLIEFFLILISITAVCIFVKYSYKRLSLLFKIKALSRLDGVTVENINVFAFLSPRITKKPAVRVKIRNKSYAVRLFSGKDKLHSVHIASAEYAVVFLKSGGAVTTRRFLRGARIVKEPARIYFPKTVIIPKAEKQANEEEIIIFSPAPKDLTYVTEKLNSIRAAFTGDKIYDFTVFDASSFINYIDRSSRGFYD